VSEVHAERLARYARATAGLDPPFALLDLDLFWANGEDLLRRAQGKPARVASKSLRCRALLERILERPGFAGLLTFTLPETLWLARHGIEDLLLAYPTADRAALRELGALDVPRPPIVMIDSADHLDLIDAAAGRGRRPIRVCLDFDTSLELAGGRVRIGAKRSPLRTPEDVAALAREVVRRPGFELAGIMGYEAHVAGLGDAPANRALGLAVRPDAAGGVGAARRAARRGRRRGAEVADVPLVNGGGTGSLETTAAEAAVTEVTVGSGFYGPTLFDAYSRFRPQPAAMYCLPVVRRPVARIATALGGGYPASGAAGRTGCRRRTCRPGCGSPPRRAPGRSRRR
jgi:D-serine deaminase-like pyridoxal phosphate-dependent protein